MESCAFYVVFFKKTKTQSIAAAAVWFVSHLLSNYINVLLLLKFNKPKIILEHNTKILWLYYAINLYNNNIQLGKAIYLWYESQLSKVFSIHSVLCTNFFSFLCKCNSECKQEPSKFCYSTKVAHHYDNVIPRKKRSKAHFFSCRSDKSMKL